MRIIACETCHIPYQPSVADLVYDLASTGSPVIFDTSKFISNDPLDPRKSVPGTEPGLWVPQLKEFKGRIVPVKSLIVIYWGDLDDASNVVKPIPLWKIRGLTKPLLKDDDGDGNPEVNTLDEMKAFLMALKGNDKWGNPLAKHPVLMKAGFLYHLDKKGEVEKIKHGQAETHDFSLSHNIVSGPNVIGSRGCKDCHVKNSPFFLRKVLLDPWDDKGKPLYTEAWEQLGIGREKLERLLLSQ